jgi:cystathionine beta-lyase/cystathionine gamma-synthase
MLSLRFHGGEQAMYAFTNALELCSIAVSLGDLKTLVYPMPKRDALIRVSVGCEDLDDLVGDIERGLTAVRALPRA